MFFKKFFNNLDAAKLALDSLTGLIVMTSVVLLIDALSPDNFIERLFSSGSVIAAAAVFFLLGSAVTGLLIDSIFHTFGRFLARLLWPPIAEEFRYRNKIMEKIGLAEDDFEWVYMNSLNRSKASENAQQTGQVSDNETKLIRFVETAGSSAYAMLLLSPATAFFLKSEYAQTNWVSWLAAFTIALGAVILFFTSFESLRKYESRKTVLTLDEIRRLNARCVVKKKKCSAVQGGRCFLTIFIMVIPLALTAALLYGAPVPVSKEYAMNIISKLDANNNVPTINLKAVVNKDKPATPSDVRCSLVVDIADFVTSGSRCQLQKTGNEDPGIVNLVEQTVLPERPEWRVMVGVEGLDKDLSKGDQVIINSLLSFDQSKDVRVPVSSLDEGNWIMPIKVDYNTRCYILALVNVNIAWE